MPLNRCGSVSARLSVWFSRRSAAAKRREVRRQHVESRPGSCCAQRVPAADDVQRRLPLGARFGQHQRAVLEVEREQTELSGNAGARLLPPEAPGDHQMKDEKQLALDLEDDPLAEAMQRDDGPPFDRGQRRVDRAQQERRREPDAGRSGGRRCAAPAREGRGGCRGAPALWMFYSEVGACPGIDPVASRLFASIRANSRFGFQHVGKRGPRPLRAHN